MKINTIARWVAGLCLALFAGIAAADTVIDSSRPGDPIYLQATTCASHRWVATLSATGAVCTQPSAADITGLGTAATVNTGTSGATIPLNNAANTFSALETFGAGIASTVTATSAHAYDASAQTAVAVPAAAGSPGTVALPSANMGFMMITNSDSGATALFGLAGGTTAAIYASSEFVGGTTPSATQSSVGWNGSAFAIYNGFAAIKHYKVILFRTH